jgi:1-acyl-sn-glycerol-3-phosphate acyltransferase
MTSPVKGFPDTFPVRDDDRRPLRYRIASLLGRVYIRLLSRRRLRLVGEENIPPTGPLLVASNHISNLDPIVFGGSFPRTLFAMAKRELFVNPLVSWFLAGCNCIPVDRGAGDRRAVSRALEVLRRGGRLLVFIEGTRSHDGAMLQVEPGIGFLARRTGASVLPVAITGTDRLENRAGLLRRGEIVLRCGPPFQLDLAGRRDDAVIANEIALRVAALLPPSHRGVYG